MEKPNFFEYAGHGWAINLSAVCGMEWDAGDKLLYVDYISGKRAELYCPDFSDLTKKLEVHCDNNDVPYSWGNYDTDEEDESVEDEKKTRLPDVCKKAD